MKIEDILKKEDQNKDKIYLYAEGIFWKAYDRSAFLFTQNIKAYTVKERHYKKINRKVKYIGFPMNSLTKVLKKEYSLSEIELGVKMTITGAQPIIDAEFENWNTNPANVNFNVNIIEEGYLSRIIHFPVLQKSPLDCQKFIIQLQNELNGRI